LCVLSCPCRGVFSFIENQPRLRVCVACVSTSAVFFSLVFFFSNLFFQVPIREGDGRGGQGGRRPQVLLPRQGIHQARQVPYECCSSNSAVIVGFCPIPRWPSLLRGEYDGNTKQPSLGQLSTRCVQCRPGSGAGSVHVAGTRAWKVDSGGVIMHCRMPHWPANFDTFRGAPTHSRSGHNEHSETVYANRPTRNVPPEA